MTDAKEKPRRPLRRNRSIYQVHYGLPREAEMARPLVKPADALEPQEYERQVAGHRGSCDKRYLGLLQCDGTVLKPLLKPSQRREVDFYELLAATEDPDLVEFRSYVPKYHGCRRFTYNGCEQEYIVLEDVVEGMAEPCIMDVKVGRQTWDQFATEEKIASERSKYPCREEYGFCIPGFQVYRLSSGQLLRYGKDYGKRLQGPAVKDALRKFLNGGLCRALLLRLLTPLWRLRRWAARQRALRPAACSLLLAYDAAALRDIGPPAALPPPRRSLAPAPAPAGAGASFSGQLSAAGPVYRKLGAVPLSPLEPRAPPRPRLCSPWSEALDKIDSSHSFDHNYEEKLCKIRMNYRATLEQLCGGQGSSWSAVRVIDFAHAQVVEREPVHAHAHDGAGGHARAPGADFAAGVGGLVGVLEELLAETDDQIQFTDNLL